MPKITKIEQQKRRSDRYSVSIDQKYAFALSANDLLAMGLHNGQEMKTEELEQLQRSAGASRAFDQALSFISLRRRSEKEVVDYLKRKEDYSSETISATVGRLRENRFIDDTEFARAWISDRNRLKPRSRRMLEQELRQKGVSLALIEQVLSELSAESEVDMAVKIAQKKLTRGTDQPKLIAYLMRQGFNYAVVKQALEIIDEAN